MVSQTQLQEGGGDGSMCAGDRLRLELDLCQMGRTLIFQPPF